MTIAINAKIHEGVVLASDSATTLIQNGGGVLNIYDHANKIFNLYKGLPIGALTYGLGNIGHASIATLAKDFRTIISKDLNPEKYTIKEIANDFSKFINERYTKAIAHIKSPKNKPRLGFVIAGYSADSDLPEEYDIRFPEGVRPKLIRPIEETGLTWNGEIEPLTRLILGHSSNLHQIIRRNMSVFKEPELANKLMQDIHKNSQISLIQPGMPIQDAINLSEYLVNLAINFAKYRPGAPSVGGPVEIAVISKHEGFKWIKRKHYFSKELNINNFVDNSTTHDHEQKDD